MTPKDQGADALPFKSLHNFRPVVQCHSDLHGGHYSVYRAARTDRLTAEELEKFKAVGVRSIIDLRTMKEYQNATGQKLLSQESPLVEVDVRREAPSGIYARLGDERDKEFEELTEVETRSEQGITGVHHYLVAIVNREYVKAIYKRLPWYFRILVLLLVAIDHILGTTYAVKAIVQQSINTRGLCNQYIDALEYSPGAIRAALRILSRPNTVPAVITCAYGKDRTGIVCALVQACLGCSRDDIVRNYCLSEKWLQEAQAEMFSYFGTIGLSKHFADAKKETILEMLDYIDNKYGSVNQYLESIGFTAEEQMALRDNLLR